jgi:hypothetical protein
MVEEASPIDVQKILGRRHVAVDVKSLCEHLDMLVGAQVAEVIMRHHEVRLGKEDVGFIRKDNPNARPREIVEKLVERSKFSGLGTVEAKLDENGRELEITIKNPCVTKTDGSGKSFLFSHWCGALSVIMGGEFEVIHAAYDPNRDVMKGRIVPHRRPTTETK